jgi:hypothetical protein
MNATSRILGEARKVRPPTKRELTDPHDAYFYAEEKLRMGRFPEGEAAIAKDPYWAYQYARHIIKGRWPEAEATIATDPVAAKLYLEAFPEAKLEWVMNGWLDWFDL